jgi:hypothetical protein
MAYNISLRKYITTTILLRHFIYFDSSLIFIVFYRIFSNRSIQRRGELNTAISLKIQMSYIYIIIFIGIIIYLVNPLIKLLDRKHIPLSSHYSFLRNNRMLSNSLGNKIRICSIVLYIVSINKHL